MVERGTMKEVQGMVPNPFAKTSDPRVPFSHIRAL